MRTVKGFTLVELLVVLSIIAILSTVAIASYTAFLKNARDSKRKADLHFIQSALEQYHADQHYYPNSLPPGSALKSPDEGKVYLTEVPNDPNGSPPYCYEGVECESGVTPPRCKSYYLYTKLERSSAPAISGCGISNTFNLKLTRP